MITDKTLSSINQMQKLIDQATFGSSAVAEFVRGQHRLENAMRMHIPEITAAAQWARGINPQLKNLFPEMNVGGEVARRLQEVARGFEIPDSFRTLAQEMQRQHEEMFRLAEPMRRYMEEMDAQTRPFRKLAEEYAAQANKWQNLARDLIGPNIAELFKPIAFPEILSPELSKRFTLKSRYWIVVDDEVFSQLCQIEDADEEALESFLVEHYLKDDCAAMTHLLEGWRACPAIQERMPIFEAVLATVKRLANDPKINVTNAVLPTLIAQLDGLKDDLIKSIPIELQHQKRLELKQDNAVEKVNHYDIVTYCIEEMINTFSALMLADVIFDVLFKHGNKIIQQDEGVFRNKILHGDKEFLDYGTKENLVRVFLYVDFVIKLIAEVQSNAQYQQAAA